MQAPQPHSEGAAVADRLSRRNMLRCLGLGAAFSLSGSLLAQTPGAAPTRPAENAKKGPVQTGFYRFKIGDLEAVALSDGGIASPVAKPVWKDAPQGKIAADLADCAMPVHRVELPFSVLAFRRGSGWVLVDAGSGKLFGPSAGFLPANMEAAGIKPSEVEAVFITHAHSDHFGGLLDTEGREPAFPGARLFIGRTEYDYWTSANPDVSRMAIPEKKARGLFPKATQYLSAFAEKWNLVAPGDKILDCLELLDAKGHTPGQMALLIRSGNEQLLHGADIVHHHALSFANPEWQYLYDSLPETAVETRHRLLDFASAERCRVFGSHLPFPGLGRVRKEGRVYRHLIEPWSSVPEL